MTKTEQRQQSVFTERSIFTREHQLLSKMLREARLAAGLTQIQLGELLDQPQAIISKCERGERRLDVIELRAYCEAMGVSYLTVLNRLEKEIKKKGW